MGRRNDNDAERRIQRQNESHCSVISPMTCPPNLPAPRSPCDLLSLRVTSDPIRAVIHLPFGAWVRWRLSPFVNTAGGSVPCLLKSICYAFVLLHGDQIFVCVRVCVFVFACLRTCMSKG